MSLRVAEFFCGIGGCAYAVRGRASIVQAIDIDQRALQVYRHNLPHPTLAKSIESLTTEALEALEADLWWMSPPCQPYTEQGRERDVHDVRAASLLHLLDAFQELRPRYLALENVPGFAESQMRQRWIASLTKRSYQVQERMLCASETGLPGRRRRYYLVAAREGDLLPPGRLQCCPRVLVDLLDDDFEQRFLPEDQFLAAYCGKLHTVDPEDPAAITRCFTSAYGKSPVRSGSYLKERGEMARHFSPHEIARLLGFPRDFRLPGELTTRQAWSLLGNSLAIPVVRRVLAVIPDLADGL